MLAKISLNNTNEITFVAEKFYLIAIFENDNSTITWSFVVECREIFKNNTIIADVYFLMDNAPKECMKKNITFKLFEGKLLIGTGVIL